MRRHIRLRKVNGENPGQPWEATSLLRIGRLDSLEVVLSDNSVSRCHAEVRATPQGWRLRDLGSTNGTRLNGARVHDAPWPLKVRDVIQIGEITLVVEALEEGPTTSVPASESLQIEATMQFSWEQALEGLAYDSRRCPRPGEQLQALLRAGHHLGHVENEAELLKSILNDAVVVLDAQRGAILLADGPESPPVLRAHATGRAADRKALAEEQPALPPHGCYSQRLARRTFSNGESILCCTVADDPELALARSIADGAMGSVLCILLRTPRRRLGVLHLDRGAWQKPFTREDLHLADALAASVSAGIESAQLFRQQRQLFLSTISLLAQAVELRDQYTGGHTARVTSYSLMLGEQLGLSKADLEWIRIGTPLHDIGKIGIDDAILRKPGSLTAEEFAVMKRHTLTGAEILQTLPELLPILPIVRSHHERWDGRGYPDGLAGERIPLLARIVAVADAFDAMTSDRPYRPGLSPEFVFAEVEKMSGLQFDPRCAAAFLAMREQVLETMRAMKATAVALPSANRQAISR